MNYVLKPTHFFLEQLDNLSYKSKQILKEKIELIKINPTRNKRILGYNLFLFRIRFSDSKKEKRLIYLLDKKEIKILCILDRDKNYKDLKKYLRKFGLL
jgi:mRNA-degrading endonuclease RelE of RelBE toxin-antitoxin system